MLSKARSAPLSSVTGHPLTLRALAVYLHDLDAERVGRLRATIDEHAERVHAGRAAPLSPAQRVSIKRAHGIARARLPDSDPHDLRTAAVETVRGALVARAARHVRAARDQQPVYGLRLTAAASGPGPYHFPRPEGRLPGYYRRARATTIGAIGEPSLARAREAHANPDLALELVQLTFSELDAIMQTLESEQPATADIAQEVANHLREGSAERQLRRVLSRAREVEFVHLGAPTHRKRPGRGPLAQQDLPPDRPELRPIVTVNEYRAG